jgi:hypothetical protein
MDRAEEEARWQEAQELLDRHGENLNDIYVAECQKLAKIADWEGIGRWVDLLYRCEHLSHSPPVIPFATIALARAGFIDETVASSHQ